MKKYSILFLPVFILPAVFGCRGECYSCGKQGKPNLSYCENDFPTPSAFKDQLAGLDSAGYTCTLK